jgi:predicted nucleic-acid-binding protein
VIGLDTNVLIRYIVRDDQKQAQKATELIETVCTPDSPGFICLVVLCEICWVLCRGYRYDRTVVCGVLRNILTSAELSVEESETAWRALRAYEKGTADFADYLIAEHNRENKATPTYTFDRKAARYSVFQLLGK